MSNAGRGKYATCQYETILCGSRFLCAIPILFTKFGRPEVTNRKRYAAVVVAVRVKAKNERQLVFNIIEAKPIHSS